MPKMIPLRVPINKKSGAISQVLCPKIYSEANSSWALLLAKAPTTPIPTREIRFGYHLRNRSIAAPEEKLPVAENKNTYEKRVPETIPCPKTFKSTRSTNSRRLNSVRAINNGKFARPILKKGIGLGITSSIMDKKSDKAANSATLSSFCNFTSSP